MSIASRLKIVAIGDSTTAGTPGFLSPLESPPNGEGDEKSQYAYWMVKAHPEWDVLNRGINGQRTDQILSRFPRDVLGEKPWVAVILGGVNDIFQGFSVQSVQKNLERMYVLAGQSGVKPIACTVLPYDYMGPREEKALASLNKWISLECGRLSIPLADTNSAVADPKDPFKLSSSPDGLHPDVEGYRKMAGAISREVEGLLARGG